MSEVFEGLYGQLIVDEPECWTTCGGGFCCSNNHPEFNFSFITQKGTEIIYLPREYMWAEEKLKTFNNTTGRAPKCFRLDVDDKISIGLVYTRCELLGICDGIVDKPLLCQIYPFIPVYDFEGNLETVMPGSVFDTTFDAIGETSPCTVKTKIKYHSYFSRPEVAARFDTYTRFYLRAAAHLSRLMEQGIQSNPALADVRGKEFWRRWELQHLSGRLFDKEALRQLVAQDYAEAQKHDPDFNLDDERANIEAIRAL